MTLIADGSHRHQPRPQRNWLLPIALNRQRGTQDLGGAHDYALGVLSPSFCKLPNYRVIWDGSPALGNARSAVT